MKSLKRAHRAKRTDSSSDSDSESVQKNSKRQSLRKGFQKPKPASKKKRGKNKDTCSDENLKKLDDVGIRETAMTTVETPPVEAIQNELSTDVVAAMLVSIV